MKTMRIKKLLPGLAIGLPIGEIVTAEPCRSVKGCYNVQTIHRPVVLRLATVPAEYLEAVK